MSSQYTRPRTYYVSKGLSFTTCSLHLLRLTPPRMTPSHRPLQSIFSVLWATCIDCQLLINNLPRPDSSDLYPSSTFLSSTPSTPSLWTHFGVFDLSGLLFLLPPTFQSVGTQPRPRPNSRKPVQVPSLSLHTLPPLYTLPYRTVHSLDLRSTSSHGPNH